MIDDLSFSTPQVEARLATGIRNYFVGSDTIVVNPTGLPVHLSGENPRKGINPMSSATLRHTTIEAADSLVLLQVRQNERMGDITSQPGWRRFFADVPLWQSPESDAGTVTLDVGRLVDGDGADERRFRVRLKLWFAPAGTDCAVHNLHDFVEVHTQVHGTGSMQKFDSADPGTLYQNVPMAPGHTHAPFCTSDMIYPWHQYRAETDCVWLAVEYHSLEMA